MPALLAASIPSSLASAVGLFRHRRAGLIDPADMPRIERAIAAARVDANWLAAYCACVGLPPNGSNALPPLVLQIAAAPLHLSILADARFPFRALGLVHLSQQVRQVRAIPSDAVIDLFSYTTDARWEKRGISFGLVTEARIAGELCWQAATRALAPGPSQVKSSVSETKVSVASTDARVEQFIKVPENCGRRYAKIAGDLNPIHQHALLARPFGFKRAIVHGTWTLARALAVAGLPDNDQFSFEAQFRRPVELPSTILVSAYRATDADGQVVTVRNADGSKLHLQVDFSGTDV